MQCAEKERLQNQCTTAWNAYVTESERAGVSIDVRNGVPMPPSISELVALRSYSQTSRLPAAYSAAIELRGRHLAASKQLSNHLSRHRC